MDYIEMQVMDKIQYVNKMLITGATLTDIVKDLKTSKGTMRRIFEAEGYIFSKHERLYLYEPGDAEIAEDPIKRLTEYEYINKRIDALELMIIELPMPVNPPSKEINILDDELTGELKVKSFKVYTTVLNSFIEFSKTCKSIKKQDLISQALLEFIKNHE
jgi:hypothetical protein